MVSFREQHRRKLVREAKAKLPGGGMYKFHWIKFGDHKADDPKAVANQIALSEKIRRSLKLYPGYHVVVERFDDQTKRFVPFTGRAVGSKTRMSAAEAKYVLDRGGPVTIHEVELLNPPKPEDWDIL